MIQDIYPHKLNNSFREGMKIKPEDTVFCFKGREILVKTEDDTFPKGKDFKDCGDALYLFSMDNRDIYLLNDPVKVPEGYEYRHVRTLRKLLNGSEDKQYVIFAVMTALQLSGWYRDNRFCGRCGSPTEPGTDERKIVCPNCGRIVYPKIVPAVIAGVTCNGKILLTKYAGEKGKRVPYYALIGGFTEIGETLEETVKREVMEETGIRVKNIRYYKSQPWGLSDDILAGFFCEADGSCEIHVDRNELKTAVWCTPEEVELQPDNLSLTNEMMTVFKNGKI